LAPFRYADLIWRVITAPGLLVPVFFVHFAMVVCEWKNRKLIIILYLQALLFLVFYLFGKIEYELIYLFNSFYYPQVTSLPYALLAIMWILCTLGGHCVLIYALMRIRRKKRVEVTYFLFAMFAGFIFGGPSHWLVAFGFNIHPAWNGMFLSFFSHFLPPTEF